ncbi:MAG: GldM family protein, partial [Bacteroidota bacterium]
IKVSASGIDGGFLDVSVSDGEVKGNQGDYTVKVDKPGIVYVTVRSYERDSTLHEESRTAFLVRPIPLPFLSINGVSGGNISRFQLTAMLRPELNLIPGLHEGKYELVSYAFAGSETSTQLYRSRGADVSVRQKRFFQELKSGDEFYLREVVILTPDGEVINLPPIRFRLN